jgi:hypothetical protein
MKTYLPKRSILYRPFCWILFALASAQYLLFFAGRWLDEHFNAMASLQINVLLFTCAVGAGLWVVEWAFCFAKNTQLSTDAKGFCFVNGGEQTVAEWSSVTSVKLSRWDLFISIPDQVVAMPLLSREEQREIYAAWFAITGLTPSRDSYIKSVHVAKGANKIRISPDS